ncbi:MAG: Rhamnosyl O-methyltransferase [Chlamydiae bacterium]|nr:Rhamnosyl O-methyltransferase [Chlamydiota bacterium]
MLPPISFDSAFKSTSKTWLEEALNNKYMYHFSAYGRPVIQLPEDLIAIQEIVWSVKPDLIIETGIAHGGSLIFNAGLLSIIEMCEATINGDCIDPRQPKKIVLGIDIDIRAHNLQAIQAHPLSKRILTLEGSSTSEQILKKVYEIAKSYKKILVILDSNHTHEHVYQELMKYSGLVTPNSYCIVLDTFIEDLPANLFKDRPWSPGNNPRTAIYKFLETNKNFYIDNEFQKKLVLTSATDGFLKKA